MVERFPLKTLADCGVALYDCEHRTPAAVQSGYPYIAIPNLRDGRIDTSSARRISAEDLARWNRRVTPRPGDVVITRRGRVGDSAPIPEGVRCAIGQNLVILRSESEELTQDYLRWATRGRLWEGEVARMLNVGAVFDSLNCGDIPKMRIPVPPLAHQHQIVGVLTALDNKIDMNRRLAETSDALASAEFAGALERGERSEVLADVAAVTMGASPPGSTYNEEGVGLPFFQGTRDFGFRFPARRVYCTEPKRVAEAGDILLSVRAPVGRLNVAVEKCVIGRGVAAVRGQLPSCVYHALRASEDVWEPYESEGTVFGSINGKALQAAPLRWPTSPAGDLESVLAPLDALVVQLLHENVALSALRDTLLPKLLSGELRVGDAEDELEEAGV